MDEGDTAPVVGEGVLYIKKSLVQSNSWMEQVIFSVILDKGNKKENKKKKETIFL